jgi:hypothetical protein
MAAAITATHSRWGRPRRSRTRSKAGPQAEDEGTKFAFGQFGMPKNDVAWAVAYHNDAVWMSATTRRR